MDDVRLLRIGEVADLLRISRTKVYELVSSGQIPSLHVGRSRRVPIRALAQWIDEQTTRAAPANPPPPTGPLLLRARSTASTARTRRAPGTRTRSAARTAPPPRASWPFFKPWMPRPMEKDEYESWVAHLDAHPDEKARVIEEMERYDRSRR